MPCPICEKPLCDRERPLGPQLEILHLILVREGTAPALGHAGCLSQYGDLYHMNPDGTLRLDW
jgi:hypothetical protein